MKRYTELIKKGYEQESERGTSSVRYVVENWTTNLTHSRTKKK